MMDEAPKSAPQRAGRRRRDWVPMGLALCVWLCTLPFVFLLIAPWFGVRVALVTALVLLVIVGMVCWVLCVGGRVRCGASTRKAEP
jgi:hypothetical protein